MSEEKKVDPAAEAADTLNDRAPKAAEEVKEEVKAAAPEAAAEETAAAAPAEEAAAKEEDAADKAEELDTPAADVEVNVIDDRDKDAENLIRWGAARAGVIVAAPFLGTVALVANEVYMISRVASVYDIKLADKAVLAFLGSFSGAVAGSLAATLIPIPLLQIPIGISVTYGVGKAAQRWIQDGMPDDVRPYLEVFKAEKKKGAEEVEELKNNPLKDQPLGDEGKDFTEPKKDKLYPEGAHEAAEKLADSLNQAASAAGELVLHALRKFGVKDEQIEHAKYTAIGASEVARETAQKAAKDLAEVARIRSKEAKEQAAIRSEELKEQAKVQLAALKDKAEEMRRLARIRAEEAKIQAARTKAQTRIRVEEAKMKATEAKYQARIHVEIAKGKASEIADKAQTAAQEAAQAAKDTAEQARTNLKNAAEDFKNKTAERAEQKKAEARKDEEEK